MRRVTLRPFTPIEGTLEECIKHFSESQGFWQTSYGTATEVYKPRNVITQLLGVERTTVHRWISHCESLPKGVNRLRLLCFMTTIGYKVAEMEDITDVDVRWISEFIGYRIATPGEIAEVMGSKGERILEVISRNRMSISDKKWELLQSFLKEREPQIELAKAKILTSLGLSPSHNGAQGSGATAPAVASMSTDSDAIVDSCTCLLSSAFPLVEQLSVNGTPKQRQLLREKIGSKMMFLISTHFNRLCSEQARKEELRKEKQEV